MRSSTRTAPHWTSAAGSFILATPTNGEGTDENQGIWFTDPAGTPTLTLPPLLEGWTYHAHFFDKHAHSIGTFSADERRGFGRRGRGMRTQSRLQRPGERFPGDRAGSRERRHAGLRGHPAGEATSSERGARSLHDSSFPMRVLETTIPLGATPRTSITLGPRTTPWPTASVTFPR